MPERISVRLRRMFQVVKLRGHKLITACARWIKLRTCPLAASVHLSNIKMGYLPKHFPPRMCPSASPCHQISTPRFSIILRQSLEIRDISRTVEIPIPRLLRQDPRLHARLPAPLRSALRHPRPVEPAPALFKARHLGHGVHHEPLFVLIAVRTWIGVGFRA